MLNRFWVGLSVILIVEGILYFINVSNPDFRFWKVMMIPFTSIAYTLGVFAGRNKPRPSTS